MNSHVEDHKPRKIRGGKLIIAIDIETTHKDPKQAHVIEIGAITDTAQTFESLCNPGIDLSKCQEALKINGITEEEILSAPPIEEVVDRFWDWIEGHLLEYEVWLAGYNSNHYDGLILMEDPWGIPPDRWRYDVMEMAMDPMDKAGVLPHHPDGSPKRPSLAEAEKFFKVKRTGTSHRALSDARVTMEILRILLGVQKPNIEFPKDR
jgi:DNA polymerase III epsilon subunit-like protein